MFGGQIIDHSSGKHYSLFMFLPATPMSPSRTIELLFELTQRPSMVLDSPRALLPDPHKYKDNGMCVELGTAIPLQR